MYPGLCTRPKVRPRLKSGSLEVGGDLEKVTNRHVFRFARKEWRRLPGPWEDGIESMLKVDPAKARR